MQYQCASLLRTKPCCVTGVLSANLLSGWRVSSSVRPQTCCSAFESTCTEKLPEASMLPDASARKARASAVCAPSESISSRSLRSSSCAIWASMPSSNMWPCTRLFRQCLPQRAASCCSK